ncbi:hypothetical protein [Parasphingorhabdus sp.]|uniref:hypothetical protein n=1 Tax=Parasphingorhabdus sp. TaxID=2709688 RepID=UPI003002CEEC
MMFALLLLSAAAQAADEAPAPPASAGLSGSWTVDLRPADDSPVYTQPMELTIAADGSVTGAFYNSEISAGRFGKARGRQCVAFVTSDGQGDYQHSACLVDGRMIGQSWAEHRKFLLPWTASRAPEAK